ncbi:MAG: recombinase family protein, partial [Eubacteriales bacterium]
KEEVVIEDDEGEIVRTIFQKALSGESIYRITRYLNTCYPDVLWTQKKVGGILKNDFYTGTCRFGKTRKILELNKIEKELSQYGEEELSQNKKLCKELSLENMTIEDRIRFGGIRYIKNNGAI